MTDVLGWIISRRVNEFLDVAGRPLGEGRAEAFRAVRTEMQTCPYPGGRYHHVKPMNVSALRNILPAWDGVVAMLCWLGHRQREWAGEAINSYSALSLVASAGAFLGDFLALRHHRPMRSGEVPLVISGLYKACQGFQLATFIAAMRESADGGAAGLPDAAGFLAYAEESGLLIGEAEVCAAPAAMIVQGYDAMTGRLPVPETLPAEVEGLGVAWADHDAFTHHVTGLWDGLVQYLVGQDRLRPVLADHRLPSDLRDRLNARLEARWAGLLAGQKGVPAELAHGALAFGIVPAPSEAATTSDELASAVLAWLRREDDLRGFDEVVAEELRTRLGPYDALESATLAGLNEDLAGVMRALGRDPPGEALGPEALSRLCGRTLRDWGSTEW
jgi:hypothetical protein